MLPFHPQREVGREQIRLGEIKADAAIERRPAGMCAGGASAAEKIDVVILAVDARFFFRAIADAEVHPLMLALRHGHARAHLGILPFGVQHFDVDELKQLHAIEAPLRVLYDAAAVQLTGFIGQLPPDHVVADAAVAHDLDRAEVRKRPWFRGKGEGEVSAVGAFGGGHARVWIPVIAQLVDGHLVRRDDQLSIARLVDFQRQAFLEPVQMIGRNDIETDEFNGRHPDRLALGNRHGHIHGILLVVQLHVESGDPRVGISTIGVKRLDPLEIGVEAGPVETQLPAPGQLRTLHASPARFATAPRPRLSPR